MLAHRLVDIAPGPRQPAEITTYDLPSTMLYEVIPHGGFFGAPEDQEELVVQAGFIRERGGLGA